MPDSGISIVVCCYNSSKRLAETLRHLALQKVPEYLNWEVIIVNNASTDDTSAIAEKEWMKYNLSKERFIVVNEPKPGLSNARECGITLAKFNIIIFCDDDNWLRDNYIQVAFDTISSNPAIGALGGQSLAVSSLPLPEWFEYNKQNYAVGKQATSSGDVSIRKFLWGSGIVVRKDVYRKAYINFPSMLTGRYGNKLSSGEDSEMCHRFLLMGYILYFSEDLIFEHFISPERLTEDYNSGLVQGFIEAYDTLNLYAKVIDKNGLPKKEKIVSLVMSLLRVLIAKSGMIRRWNLHVERLNIFMLTGYKFKNIDNNLICMRQLSK